MERLSCREFLRKLGESEDKQLEGTEFGIVLSVRNDEGTITRYRSPDPLDLTAVEWKEFMDDVGRVLDGRTVL